MSGIEPSVEGEAGVATPTNALANEPPNITIDVTAQPATAPPSSSSPLPPPAASPASSSPPAAADDNLTPDQLRSKKMFERWQRAFLGAADKQPEEYILAMLREGEDLVRSGLLDLNRSIKPASGSTFLHTVAWFQKRRIMEWLLSHGANPNQGNLKGNTPLHLLCEQANKDIAPQLIQLMVDYGGDLELKDGGETPASSIEKARSVGFDVMTLDFTARTKFLAARDGAPGGRPGELAGGMSDADRAAAVEKCKLVYRKLSTLFLGLEAEGVSQAVDDAIVRILTTNMSNIHLKILDVNAPPLANEGNMKTFLHYAVIARRPEIVRVLLVALAEPGLIDAQDEGGDTALHVAISLINAGTPGIGRNIVNQLLDAGSSTTITNYLKGLTPLQMAPTTIPAELRNWLREQVTKPRLDKNSLANQFGIGGSASSGANAGGAGGAASSLSPSPLGSPHIGGGGGIDRQDRIGARAMMARMASSLGVAGGTSALGLIQKSSNLGAPSSSLASRRASGGFGGGALQQIMAAKGVVLTDTPGGGVATPAVAAMKKGANSGVSGGGGLGLGIGSKRLVRDERTLNLDRIFDTLDLSDTNSITPVQLQAYHELLHGCHGSCTLTLVGQVLDGVIPQGQCTRTNLLEVLIGLEQLCLQQSTLKWDFRMFDKDGLGTLSTQDGTNGFDFAPAELLWTLNQHDPTTQLRYEDYLLRKTKQEKVRPKEIRWWEIQAELGGKVPSLG